MNKVNNVLSSMVLYYGKDIKRINHFLKVYGFVKLIGTKEKLDIDKQEVLEIAALTHDIGIKNSEIKHHSSSGSYQQVEGPPEAKKMLEYLKINKDIVERVCWLIAHHHTYSNINSVDYQILVEADFLVNIFEDEMPIESVKNIREKIFKTEAGLKLLTDMYLES